jgi:hypothetical protein
VTADGTQIPPVTRIPPPIAVVMIRRPRGRRGYSPADIFFASDQPPTWLGEGHLAHLPLRPTTLNGKLARLIAEEVVKDANLPTHMVEAAGQIAFELFARAVASLARFERNGPVRLAVKADPETRSVLILIGQPAPGGLSPLRPGQAPPNSGELELTRAWCRHLEERSDGYGHLVIAEIDEASAATDISNAARDTSPRHKPLRRVLARRHPT